LRVESTHHCPLSIQLLTVSYFHRYSLNTKITFEDKPLELFREEARSTDWGPAVDVILLERVKSSGYEEHGFVSHDVQKHCGHRGETFAEYVENHGSMTPKELAFLKP
jgi:hypothetical protein